MGAILLLTEEAIKTFAQASEMGAPLDAIARAHDISPRTAFLWKAAGRKAVKRRKAGETLSEDDDLRARFYEAITKARGRCELRCIDLIATASIQDWRAAREALSLMRPERYSKSRMELTGKNGGPVKTEGTVTLDAIDAALKAAQTNREQQVPNGHGANGTTNGKASNGTPTADR